jgi:hypothetical protein
MRHEFSRRTIPVKKKTLQAFVFLALCTLVRAEDPVAGQWDWGGGQKANVLANGSVSTTSNWTGHWTLIDGSQRIYSFQWNQSSTPNILTLSADNTRLIERYQGHTYIRTRAVSAAALGVSELQIEGFSEFKAEQQAPVWCWAACIQMMLKQHGIEWNQKDIASEVKGRAHDIEAATAEEITKALSGLRPTTPSGTVSINGGWSADCLYFPVVNNVGLENVITRSIAVQRPLIMSFRAGSGVQHVVLVFKVAYQPEPSAMEIREDIPIADRVVHTSFRTCKKLLTMTFYDPLTDEGKTVPFGKVEKDIQGLWSSFVVKNDSLQRTFDNRPRTF